LRHSVYRRVTDGRTYRRTPSHRATQTIYSASAYSARIYWAISRCTVYRHASRGKNVTAHRTMYMLCYVMQYPYGIPHRHLGYAIYPRCPCHIPACTQVIRSDSSCRLHSMEIKASHSRSTDQRTIIQVFITIM